MSVLVPLPEPGGLVPLGGGPCCCGEPAKVVVRAVRRMAGPGGGPASRETVEAVCPACLRAGRILSLRGQQGRQVESIEVLGRLGPAGFEADEPGRGD